ncbi:MAG TPA: GFA family protein [Rhizomicrobium sp.]|jgi:hypothetical protein
MSEETWTGGCLCGALRFEATGTPAYMGHCYCNECRKASGSGFIPFAQMPADRLRITGDFVTYSIRLPDGRVADRNFCPRCGGLVFGGVPGKSEAYTIYGGSFDDPSRFKPAIAIFMSERAPWAAVPPGLKEYERLPS